MPFFYYIFSFRKANQKCSVLKYWNKAVISSFTKENICRGREQSGREPKTIFFSQQCSAFVVQMLNLLGSTSLVTSDFTGKSCVVVTCLIACDKPGNTNLLSAEISLSD